MSFDVLLLGNHLCLAPPPRLVHSPGPVDQEEGEALDVARGPHQKAVSRDSLKNRIKEMLTKLVLTKKTFGKALPEYP